MNKLPIISLIAFSSTLVGCSFWQDESYKVETPTVAETVKTLPKPALGNAKIEHLTVAELVQRFEQLDRDSADIVVVNRLAQLRLRLMEEELSIGETDYQKVIETLEQLRSLQDDPTARANVDYQLARVRSMAGEGNVAALLSESIEAGVNTEKELEARFRRAEINFSNSNYDLAEQDFAKVAAAQGEFRLHAMYMLAWTRFKTGALDEALAATTSALAELHGHPERKYQELTQDLLRVTILALDYLDGPETLAALVREGKPDYQTDIYRALGDWYLSKSRFADSAQTWQTFLAENPLHRDAPNIALEVIATQREAGFTSDIPELEKRFIERYGKQTEFYAVHGDEVFTTYEVPLRGMLDRYTQRLHVRAQETQEGQDYERSAAAYEIWLANFSDTHAGQEKRFLFAEVLALAYGFVIAMPQFEQVFELNKATEFGREAAYALVLGSNKRQEELGAEAVISFSLQFAASYPADARAAQAQLNAAKRLFESRRYEETRVAAETGLSLTLSVEEQKLAQQLLAHSAFELNDFVTAERVYRELDLLGEDVIEQVLASVFKQAERAEIEGDLASAVVHYDRLYDIDPTAELSRNAMYDVAALYEQMAMPEQAIAQLERYRKRYPTFASRSNGEIARRLVYLRESSGDLIGAASELVAMSQAGDGDVARAAKYRAAELYLEVDDLPQAIMHFRDYAHTYLEPVSVRLEAMHHMDLLYQKTDEPKKRNYWLRKKRDLFNELNVSDRTERARYLAANALFELNAENDAAFMQAKLMLPLSRTLKKKQQLLKRNVNAYEAVIEVGVFEYTTLSYLRMAKHFENLAESLLSAEQPRGLNALEQEQYVLLLEEQAFPFEEKAIALHEQNLALGWRVGWNESINDSLLALQALLPARFQRPQAEVAYVDAAE